MGKEGRSKAQPGTALQQQTRYFGRGGSIGRSPVSFLFVFLKIAQVIPCFMKQEVYPTFLLALLLHMTFSTS